MGVLCNARADVEVITIKLVTSSSSGHQEIFQALCNAGAKKHEALHEREMCMLYKNLSPSLDFARYLTLDLQDDGKESRLTKGILGPWSRALNAKYEDVGAWVRFLGNGKVSDYEATVCRLFKSVSEIK